jgi:hypothetical protein
MLDANAAQELRSGNMDSLEPPAANLKSKGYREVDPPAIDLKPGDLVEVRSAAEIMASLDGDGKLDGLPFMPEMLAYCGRRLHVSKRADNTCALGQPRRIEGTVHLEQTRCDGSAHRGCEAGCLFLWREAWLRRATNGADESGPTLAAVPAVGTAEGAYRLLSNLAQKPNNTLMCQSTELNSATCPAPIGSTPGYFAKVARDSASGKRSFSALRQLAIYFWGKAILKLFMLWARAPWNADRYRKTPATPLDLQPGEVVRVRGMFEILRTLDRNGCNRGMEFKPEMFQFCGRKYPVTLNMTRRIDERSGELKGFRSPCIVLESVYCQGQRSFCQRANYHYWREIWLSRQ